MAISSDVFSLPTFAGSVDGSPTAMFKRISELTVLADRLGFSRAWFAEHHFQPHGGILSAPDVLIAALAERAPRIRFGLGVVQVPYHHPLSVAERIATLDQVTGGRVELGLGRAFLKCEYDGFGIPMTESRARFNEGVEVIVTALTGKEFAHDGRFFQFPELHVEPPCVQEPPPVWVAAATTPETFEWAGRNGFNLMVAPLLSPDLPSLGEKVSLYLNAWTKSDPPQIIANVHVHVAAEDEQALTEAEAHLGRYVDETRAAGASAIATFHRDGVPADFKHYPALGKRWFDFTVRGAVKRGAVAVGSPTNCRHILSSLVDQLHCTSIAATFDFGQPQELVEQSMLRYMNEVAGAL
ncbi:LLM class flavin-dependent oxidoreductase [Amycolatopsis sp. NBC_00348]|uniref:LLM class flavin-dependent oxidoreductase n=1 Tax=Amycolatopsis sp. NBC_00348 TaxID=2975956 RepID=UPI002E26BA33